MCGICGIVSKATSKRSSAEYTADVRNMTRVMRHRGPDSEGFYSNADKGVFLGHRRLSIIDLSEDGNQPFVSEDGSIVALVNGEIYNYLELRKQLIQAGHKFSSESDSEVVLHLYEE